MTNTTSPWTFDSTEMTFDSTLYTFDGYITTPLGPVSPLEWTFDSTILTFDSTQWYFDGYSGLPNTVRGCMNFAPFGIIYQPQNFVATIAGTQVTLTWNAIPSPFVCAYNIRRDNALITSVAVPTPATATVSFTDTVSLGRRYHYNVSVTDACGNEGLAASLHLNVSPSGTLTFESVYQIQPGEGGYPDIVWRWN